MKRIGQLLVVLGIAAAVACNTDRTNEGTNVDNRTGDAASEQRDTVGTSGVNADDRNFVEESYMANMAEVELGKMAEGRASSPEVKKFAQMMVQDHTKSREELNQIAQQYSITPPSALDEEHQDLRMRLSNLKGAEFDRAYMDAMVNGHEDVAGHLQSRADVDQFGENKGAVRPEQANDPVESRLNQWAAKALPVVRHHLDEARRVQDSLENAGTRSR